MTDMRRNAVSEFGELHMSDASVIARRDAQIAELGAEVERLRMALAGQERLDTRLIEAQAEVERLREALQRISDLAPVAESDVAQWVRIAHQALED